MFKGCLINVISKKDAMSKDELFESKLIMPFPKDCTHCRRCEEMCMTSAITIDDEWRIDLGRCTFCMDCMDACDRMEGAVAPDYSLTREGLIFSESEVPVPADGRLPKEFTKALGKSVGIREIDTGSCNACESEINCCSNPYYDMGRFGLKIVASPRHADVLLVTGPMTENMAEAAVRTYDAAPFPKAVIAMGTCAISGGPFADGDVRGGTDSVLKADMYVTGCPPSPDRLIRSILTAFGIARR